MNTALPYAPYPPLPSRSGKGPSAASPQASPGGDGGELSAEDKFNLILSVGEECVTVEELRSLVANKPGFQLYDGFEPSGRMHIAQGIFKAVNVNKCTQAGGVFVFWVADWFALMNDKLGGNLDNIQTVGQYFIEVWRAAGMDMSKVRFAWAAEDITAHADKYWAQALDVARRFTIARITKCCQIMGRTEGGLTAAQILYPIMQCTDIFFLRANVCQLGVDQRKVNMLAREYCDSAGIKNKPIILSHHMLYGLKKGQAKMSKSDPDSAIFMEDTPEDVHRKIMQAYCPREPEEHDAKPEGESMHLAEDALKNPCLDYVGNIVLSRPGATFEAGGRTFSSFADVKTAFVDGALSETQLKEGLIARINELLQPVRNHFANDAHARDVLERVKLIKKTASEPVAKTFRHLRLGDFKDTCAVFAPMPTAYFNLTQAVDLLACLSGIEAGRHVVLWLPDWSAFVLNHLGGNTKAIDAAYTVLVEALRALAPDVMERVDVRKQSEVTLLDPGNYWISVINVGRAFTLQRIRDVDPSNDQAGHVIASMMHVGDVLATGATEIRATQHQQPLHELALEYFDKAEAGSGMPSKPKLTVLPSADLCLKPHLEGEAAKNDIDNQINLNDLPAAVKKKIKQAFCEPGNVDVCPPISIAQHAILGLGGKVLVTRKPENGGNKEYGGVEELRGDFASGALHPGDLKPSLGKHVDELVDKVRQRAQSNADLKKAEATLKNFIKQAAKKK